MRLISLITIIISSLLFSNSILANESKRPETFKVDRKAVQHTMKEDKTSSDKEQCVKMGGTWITNKCCFGQDCQHPDSEQFQKLRKGL